MHIWVCYLTGMQRNIGKIMNKKRPSSIRIQQIGLLLLLVNTAFFLAACQHYGLSIPATIANAAPVDTITAVAAFPGAEGFGAYTPGGRGGRVIDVTNLNDSGVGSLRAAIDAEGPRIVVFRVGGTIELESRLDIQHPYITIAGQTAPGGGILLRNAPGNKQTPIRIKSHDVVLRYLRSRPGPSSEKTDTLDALEIKASQNVIIDHSSFSWATDETPTFGKIQPILRFSGASLPKACKIVRMWKVPQKRSADRQRVAQSASRFITTSLPITGSVTQPLIPVGWWMSSTM